MFAEPNGTDARYEDQHKRLFIIIIIFSSLRQFSCPILPGLYFFLFGPILNMDARLTKWSTVWDQLVSPQNVGQNICFCLIFQLNSEL